MMNALPVSVAIPTYGREEVLLETIRQVLAQRPAAAEVLVLDQTPAHERTTGEALQEWHEQGHIRWVRLATPSQPAALNRALREARQPVVIFLDDDIEIATGFVDAHARHYRDPAIWAVAGQVLQPGEQEWANPSVTGDIGPFADIEFSFRSATRTFVRNGMSGNLSVRTARAIEIGGFDENFIPPVSYRFDAEFCKRLCRAGGRILFEPAARVHHLRCGRGGTRSSGSHLTSASPAHGVGDYYFALRQGLSPASLRYIARRPFREVRTRFHLRHPWWIPVKVVGELRALALALRFLRRGPRYIGPLRSAHNPERRDGRV